MGNILQPTTGAPVDSSSATNKDLPAWYQTYTQNLGSNAVDLAHNLNNQPLPQASVAGFNQDQLNAMQGVRDSQGVYMPLLNKATALTDSLAPTTNAWLDKAMSYASAPAASSAAGAGAAGAGVTAAAAGNSRNWTDESAKYMSPYTSAVVDNIARLGKRNWEENIMPGVNSSAIGSGQFGSTRNADILSRAGITAADDITGQQSNALQSGYFGSANIFNNDANRTLQNKSLQVNAATSAGGWAAQAAMLDAQLKAQQQALATNSALHGADTNINMVNSGVNDYGALGNYYQTMIGKDNSNLMAIGDKQQGLQQSGLDTAYKNAMQQREDPWTQLKNASGIVNASQLPNLITTSTSQSGAPGTSPLGGALSAYFLAQGLNSDGSTPKAGTQPA